MSILNPKADKTELWCNADVTGFCGYIENIGFLRICQSLTPSCFQPLEISCEINSTPSLLRVLCLKTKTTHTVVILNNQEKIGQSWGKCSPDSAHREKTNH